MEIPRWRVPRVAASWSWEDVPPLPPLVLAADGGPAEQPTRVRVGWDDEALHVRFDCEDRHAWGSYRRRDNPVYEEEAVEVFLAPGEADPARYAEFEVSPLGVLFDALIHNPTSRRADLEGDPAWDCPGIRWEAGRGTERQDWWATLSIPWRGVLRALSALSALSGDPAEPPRIWRANFYRIERPQGSAPEFTCWSPTLTQPADFHKPARFGVLELI